MSKADAPPGDWERSLGYFRKRRSVLFLSYCRFWERHGFVQQSLALLLARNGVNVVWLDGAGWRRYHPVVYDPHPNLEVSQLAQLPLRRVPGVSQWDDWNKSLLIGRRIARLGGNPVIWIQGGIDESLAARLPYIDVFSVFDDPYRHEPSGNLCRKAKVILCQNETARAQLGGQSVSKAQVLWPPVDMSDESIGVNAEVFLPAGFPPRVMGYVGSFFSDGFDLDLFEKFIQGFPDWGFVLMGRTDAQGAQRLRSWKQYRNFQYFPWVPRNQVASVWKKIRLTLLFYRSNRTQDGAFAVKVVESLRFGVPCLATQVPKTADLEGIFPRKADLDGLKSGVEEALAIPSAELENLYKRFASRMDPKHHLTEVARCLS